ncbi:MAG: heparinase II/III family protein [Rhodospirillales bacterium]|nr:heparinase II/III family protein [Rhodospirillales bacterium]
MVRRRRRSRWSDFWRSTPFYGFLLKGRTPARLARLVPAPLAGSAARGESIVGGMLACAGRGLPAERPDWFAAGISDAALDELNAFEWLDDLAACGTEAAQSRARALVEDWIYANPGWRPGAWDPATTGRRLAAWLAHAPFLSRGEGDRFGPMFLESAARQARHLARAAPSAPAGVARLAALCGLVYAQACGLVSGRDIVATAQRLGIEARRQLLDDGFHAARGGGAQFEALTLLTAARGALEICDAAAPADLNSAIDALVPAVRFFRHGDGGFALFENTNSGDPRRIDAVLARAGSAEPAPASARAAGFERVAVDRLLLIADCGAPPGPGFDASAHAGALSFELSSGRDRIVVNCGAGPGDSSDWSLALRATPAHSTLTLEDTSSSEPIPDGLTRRVPHVEGHRDEVDGNTWLEMKHDGYARDFGFTHVRRIFVANDGRDVRGEDSLVPVEGGRVSASARFAVRFHLAPDLQASIVQNGAAALLRTPSGQAWRLQAAGAALEIGESVSFAARGMARRSEQIVAAGTADARGISVKWAFKRVSDR